MGWVVPLHATPCFGRSVLVKWRKRTWRFVEDACRVETWTKDDGHAAKRSNLTTREVSWADQSQYQAPRKPTRMRNAG